MIIFLFSLFKSPRDYLKILFISGLLLTASGLNAQTAVEKYGQLRVSGNKIVDKNNNPVVLRGMSLFWSQWIGKYYNKSTIQWLKEDWCINVVRAAMAVDNGGYATNPAEKEKVIAVVDAAIELGIYVIIDFHVHDAPAYLTEAHTFFDEMSKKYKDHPNVLYEIWNEPVNVTWPGVVKPYCEAVISTIRKNDPDNIIICGTPNYSQDVDIASGSPILEPNIAYTLHYYAATHKQGLRDKATLALKRGIALFVTEYGTCAANGAGSIDEAESRAWWTFLEQNKIGYCNWSVADKNETSAALLPGASTSGGWPTSMLSASGLLVREQLLSVCDGTHQFKLGINSPGQLDNLSINAFYPNPFSNTMSVKLNELSEYKIYDMLGNIWEKGAGEGAIEVGKLLSPGTYIINIKVGDREKNVKINKI